MALLKFACRSLALVGALAMAGCAIDRHVSIKDVDDFYDLGWREIIRSSHKPITKPRLDPLQPADLRTLRGTYSFDYGGVFGEASLSIRGNRWTLIHEGVTQTGHWVVVGNKVLLMQKHDDLRAILVRVHAKWHFTDLDVDDGIAVLKPKA